MTTVRTRSAIFASLVVVGAVCWLLSEIQPPEPSPRPTHFESASNPVEPEEDPPLIEPIEKPRSEVSEAAVHEPDERVEPQVPPADPAETSVPVSEISPPACLVRLRMDVPENLSDHTALFWKVARDAVVGAVQVREMNGFGVAGRALWNFANLEWHERPDDQDPVFAAVWEDLMTRICGRPGALDTERFVEVLRHWSQETDAVASDTYRAHGIDPASLHRYSYEERRDAKAAILNAFGVLYPDFVADVTECLEMDADIEAWEELTSWLVSDERALTRER